MATLSSYIGVFMLALALITVSVWWIGSASTSGGWGTANMPTSFNKTTQYASNMQNRSIEFQSALRQSTNTGSNELPIDQWLRMINASIGLAIAPLMGLLDIGFALINDSAQYMFIPPILVGLVSCYFIFYIGGAIIKSMTGGAGVS